MLGWSVAGQSPGKYRFGLTQFKIKSLGGDRQGLRVCPCSHHLEATQVCVGSSQTFTGKAFKKGERRNQRNVFNHSLETLKRPGGDEPGGKQDAASEQISIAHHPNYTRGKNLKQTL